MTHPDKALGDHFGIWWRSTPQLEGQKVGSFSVPGSCEEIDQAEELLRQQGCTLAIAPMEGNTWKRHRAVIESDGSDPFLLEPFTSPETATLLKGAGYNILARYSSSLVDLATPSPDLSRLETRLDDITIRPLRLENLEAELRAIYRLSTRAFVDNFLYHPISESDFLAQYLPLQFNLTEECAYLAHDQGELVGYIFGYPSDHSFVVKTLAVLPQRKLAGLGTLLVDRMQQGARSAGFQQAIHALQREENQSLRISQRFNGMVFRRYALFSKAL